MIYNREPEVDPPAEDCSAATSRKRSNIPPVIFSPRFFRLLWLILRERFRGR